MSDLFAALFGGAVDTYNNERNIAFQRWANNTNIDFMRDTNAQNEALMREGWARDDNAVQRRTADLEAAGMNPILAAGGGASSGAPIQLKNPSVQAPSSNLNPMVGVQMANAVADINAKKAATANTKAGTKLIDAQRENVDLEGKLKAGTLEPRIQEAATAAKVALESADAQIVENRADAKRALAEADSAQLYYSNRVSLQGPQFDKAYIEALRLVREWNFLGAEKPYAPETVLEQGLQAELQRKQAEAITAAAAAGLRGMDASFYKKIGISPAAGDRIFEALRLLVSAAGTLKK